VTFPLLKDESEAKASPRFEDFTFLRGARTARKVDALAETRATMTDKKRRRRRLLEFMVVWKREAQGERLSGLRVVV